MLTTATYHATLCSMPANHTLPRLQSLSAAVPTGMASITGIARSHKKQQRGSFWLPRFKLPDNQYN